MPLLIPRVEQPTIAGSAQPSVDCLVRDVEQLGERGAWRRVLANRVSVDVDDRAQVLGAIRATFQGVRVRNETGDDGAYSGGRVGRKPEQGADRDTLVRVDGDRLAGRSTDLDTGDDRAVGDCDGRESEDPVRPVREVVDDDAALGPGDERTRFFKLALMSNDESLQPRTSLVHMVSSKRQPRS